MSKIAAIFAGLDSVPIQRAPIQDLANESIQGLASTAMLGAHVQPSDADLIAALQMASYRQNWSAEDRHALQLLRNARTTWFDSEIGIRRRIDDWLGDHWITDDQFGLADYYEAYVYSDGLGGIYAVLPNGQECKFSILTPLKTLRVMLRGIAGVDAEIELMVSVCASNVQGEPDTTAPRKENMNDETKTPLGLGSTEGLGLR